MKIAVIGTGYVGTVTAAVFANYTSHHIIGIDTDLSKVRRLNIGEPIIREPDLEKLLQIALKNKKIEFSNDYKDLAHADIAFTCVGTPSNEDGSVNISYVCDSAEQFAKHSKIKNAIFVIKSTVPPGTAQKCSEIIKKYRDDVAVVSNPEFLKEGSAVNDFIYGHRIVIGMKDDVALYVKAKMQNIYQSLPGKIYWMSNESAELAKYACNAFLAMKITYANFIADCCERFGADSKHVLNIMKNDQRIGGQFLDPGMGFGGSCFPKDVNGLLNITGEEMLNNMLWSNYHYTQWAIRKIMDKWPEIEQKDYVRIGIFGVTFKPNTDDCRESPTAYLLDGTNECDVLNENTSFMICDSNHNINNFKKECSRLRIGYDKVEFENDIEKVINNSTIIIICVDNPELRNYIPYFEKFLSVGGHIFDARCTLSDYFDSHALYSSRYHRVGKK